VFCARGPGGLGLFFSAGGTGARFVIWVGLCVFSGAFAENSKHGLLGAAAIKVLLPVGSRQDCFRAVGKAGVGPCGGFCFCLFILFSFV